MNTASLDGIIVPIRNGGAQMAEQRVPNLEEMGEQEAHSFLTQLFSTLSPEEVYEANHPKDYVMEMPQSGELVRGRENMREFQEAYPNSPSIRLRRVLIRAGLWVAAVVNDYGAGQVYHVAMILGLKDGKVGRYRPEYFELFEVPKWK